MRGVIFSLLIVAGAGGLAGCGQDSAGDPVAVLHEAADRSIGAPSYRVRVWQNGRSVEDITVDRRRGMTVKLRDGSEARQVGTEIAYRRGGGSREWLTAPTLGQSSIVDFGVRGLRAAQGASSARRAGDRLEFDSEGVRSSALVKDGYIVEVTQSSSSPVHETRRFTYSQFGHALAVEAPPESDRRPATADDCRENRGGPLALVCASVLVSSAVSTSTTATR